MYITISIKRILALFLFLVGAAAGILTCVQIGHAEATSAKVQTEEIELPIIMYHSMLKDGSGKYIISPDTFEAVSYTHLDVYKRQPFGSLWLQHIKRPCCALLTTSSYGKFHHHDRKTKNNEKEQIN